MKIKNGLLIVVEGLQGAGKSTLIKNIISHLNKRDFSVKYTEWNSDPYIKPANRSMKQKRYFTPRLFCLINACDFCSRYDKIVDPALKEGDVVVCDRYIYTALSRDSARRVDEDYVRSVYSFAREPDLIFYVDTPLELACKRKSEDIIKKNVADIYYYNSGMDITGLPMDESMIIYQRYLKRKYEELFKDKQNVVVLNGEQSIEIMCKKAITEITKILEPV